MGPRLCDLSTEFAGASAVLVDHVVERHVVPRQLLLLRDDQRPVYVWDGNRWSLWGSSKACY